MKKLFLFFVAVMAALMVSAQTMRTVTGQVVSAADGEALVGATVMPIGGGQGTSTDMSGEFRLSVPDNVKILQVSYVGMETVKAEIKAGHMTIALRSTDNSLDEVMVVAYGTAKKSSFTGAASTISSSSGVQCQQGSRGCRSGCSGSHAVGSARYERHRPHTRYRLHQLELQSSLCSRRYALRGKHRCHQPQS